MPLPPRPPRRPPGLPPGGGSGGDPWAQRWARLARGLGLDGGEPLLVALSGGADSVLLLHLLAAARPRAALLAVHVNHGLRGADSDADETFCRDLCAELGVEFRARAVALEPAGPSLEARARTARYRVLLAEARASGHLHLATGHHADDALETLLLRWIRGTAAGGLAGPHRRLVLRGTEPGQPAEELDPDLAPVVVLRPLATLRRTEIQSQLEERGLAWREDGSNRDPAHARNRVRHGLVPVIEELCGPDGLERLAGFGRAVEGLEQELAAATAHLDWTSPVHAVASRGPRVRGLGGGLERGALCQLAPALRRRALWRLLTEGTGYAPTAEQLEALLHDLARARTGRRNLAGGWKLVLRSARLELLPPADALAPSRVGPRAVQAALPFPPPRDSRGRSGEPRGRSVDGSRSAWFEARGPEFALQLPGVVDLPDGRRLSASVHHASPSVDVPRSATLVELDAERLPGRLTVRWPRAGDRFHPLGAPGSRRLARFLADAGVPREERGAVPLVYADDELLWVVGLRPGEARRVRPRTRERLLLELHGS